MYWGIMWLTGVLLVLLVITYANMHATQWIFVIYEYVR
jgi:hypothetical protein